MKNRKFELFLIALGLIAVSFCIGFYTGQSAGKHTVVITTSKSAEETLSTLEPEATGSVPVSRGLPADAEDGKVNINTADVYTLASLPGIGRVLAERIVEYRSSFGPFRSTEELMNVTGIGEVKFDAIKDDITV